MITAAKIEELASGKGVKRSAVENFLHTLQGMTYHEAILNVEMDKRSYCWNDETSAAIRVGLAIHFTPRNMP